MFLPFVPPFIQTPDSSSVFVANQDTATVNFGDGLNGRTLPDGSSVVVDYGSGNGAAGNVPSPYASDTWCIVYGCP